MVYTYDVHWAAIDVSLASRWDAYLKMLSTSQTLLMSSRH